MRGYLPNNMPDTLPTNRRHAHPLSGEDIPDIPSFDPLLRRWWIFPYKTFDGREGYLGEYAFPGTLEEAEQEAHARADRFEFSETFISEITLESRGVVT